MSINSGQSLKRAPICSATSSEFGLPERSALGRVTTRSSHFLMARLATVLVFGLLIHPSESIAAGDGASADPRPPSAEIPTWFPPEGQTLNEPGFEPYADSAGTVVRLSIESIVPVTRFGRPLNPARPWYSAYREGVDRFPSARSCLIDEERDRPRPDLTRFDWRKVTTYAQAEVCIFRIATSYRTVEGFERWMLAQGLTIGSGYTQRYRPDRNYVGGNDFATWGRRPLTSGSTTEDPGQAAKQDTEKRTPRMNIGVIFRPGVGVYEVAFSFIAN